jgi:outer membrane lipoprotein-sorting protein
MSGQSPGRLVLVIAVVLVASVGVTVALTTLEGDSSSGTAAGRPVLAGNASAQLAGLDGLTATRETIVRRGNETTRTVERVRLDLRHGRLRARTLSGPGEVDLRVSNGSVRWLYNRSSNTVTRLDREGSVADPDNRERIPRLLEQLRRADGPTTASATTPTPGVEPLPAVPAAASSGRRSAEPAGTSRGAYGVSLVGNSSVGGRSTYVVEIGQDREGAGPVANYTQTLWLDAERHYPLQRRTAWTQGGERTVITTTYRNVTFNPTFETSTFEFEVPPNATVDVPETPDQRRYDTVAALRAAANMSVPGPGVPESFVLARATRTTGRVTSVGARYVNATAVLEVAKLRPVYPTTTEGERVTVAGRNATYRNLGPEQTVVWNCDGAQYKVSGQGLPRSVMLGVAASVGCG